MRLRLLAGGLAAVAALAAPAAADPTHFERECSGTLDFASLAQRFRLSGGYIRNACLRAAFLAAQDGGALAQRHLAEPGHVVGQAPGQSVVAADEPVRHSDGDRVDVEKAG